MSDVNAQLFYVGETSIFIWLRAFFMHFEVWCCNNMQKIWLALTFQSAVLKQLVVSYGFVSNNNTKSLLVSCKINWLSISEITPLA